MSYYGPMTTYTIGGASPGSPNAVQAAPLPAVNTYQPVAAPPPPQAPQYNGYYNEVHTAQVNPMKQFYSYDHGQVVYADVPINPTRTAPPPDQPGTYSGPASPIFEAQPAPADLAVASKGQKITVGFDCMVSECGKPMYRFYWDVKEVCGRDDYCKEHLPEEVLAFDKNHNGRFSIREYSDMMCEGTRLYNYYMQNQGAMSDQEKVAKGIPILKAGDLKFLDGDQDHKICPSEFETWFVQNYELVKVDPTDPIIRSMHRQLDEAAQAAPEEPDALEAEDALASPDPCATASDAPAAPAPSDEDGAAAELAYADEDAELFFL
eukprot:tig00020961_g16669.t1